MENCKRDIAKYWYITNKTINMMYWFDFDKSETKKLLAKEKKEYKKYKKEHKQEIKNFESRMKAEEKLKKLERKPLKKRDNWLYQKVFRLSYWDIKECMICWSKINLQIHHKDKNWRNNKADNLIMLCRDCHAKAHSDDKYVNLISKRRNNIVID